MKALLSPIDEIELLDLILESSECSLVSINVAGLISEKLSQCKLLRGIDFTDSEIVGTSSGISSGVHI